MIYLDNAATTPVRQEVLDVMMPLMSEGFANPSSVYKAGRKARAAIEEARGRISEIIGSASREIYFTASGTESANWAIKGVAEANTAKGKHIITSAIEHPAVLESCKYLKNNGWEITYLPVDTTGLVPAENLDAAIRPDTVLCSIMFANNEIGVVQPIKELATIARRRGVLFHTDAVQAFGREKIDIEDMNIDLLSISAHKIYGPKGIGVLYARTGVKIEPFVHGGGQERGRRSGTENVPAISGFGLAASLMEAERDGETARQTILRDNFIAQIQSRISHTSLNGHPTRRLCNNINISFDFIEGESVLLMLDMKGFAASSGSACTSGALDPSHVLLAMGMTHERAHGSLRISLGRETAAEELDKLADELEVIVKRLREMSPLYEDQLKN